MSPSTYWVAQLNDGTPRCYGWQMLTSLCLSASIFISGHWSMKWCINGGPAVLHYESRWQEFGFFSQDLPLRSGGRNIHVEVPILSTQRDLKVFDRLTLSFFSFHCLSFFIWGDVATGTKSLVWVQPFLSNEFRSSCGDVCSPELKRDENTLTCFYGCHPSPESTNHP